MPLPRVSLEQTFSVKRLPVETKPKSHKSSVRRRPILTIIGISFLLHLVVILLVGSIIVFQIPPKEEPVFEAPAVPQEPIQQVQISILSKSTPPPPLNVVHVNQVKNMELQALPALPSIMDKKVGIGKYRGGHGLDIAPSMPTIDFFGILAEKGSRILFLVDISGSMVQDGRSIETFEAVEEEIQRTLSQMKGIGTFNIIGFAAEANTFRGSAIEIQESSIESASKWLKRYSPAEVAKKAPNPQKVDWKNVADGRHLGTRVDLALKEAFQMSPDIIFVLSDGEPSGKNPGEILAMVSALQAGQKKPIVINAISYKSKEGRDFLKKLAQSNSGTYQEQN